MTTVNSGIPLYTTGHGFSSTLDGFTKAFDFGYGNDGFSLFTKGHVTINSGVNLWTEGMLPSSSGLNLYTYGIYSHSSGVDLYLEGYLPSSSGLSLWTEGSIESSSGIDIYVEGAFQKTMPLYSHGHYADSASMPIYVRQGDWVGSSGSVNLFTHGFSGDSQIYKTVPVYVFGEKKTTDNIPLYLEGYQPAVGQNATFPLFVKSIGNLDGSITLTDSVNIYVENNWTAHSSGVNLYVASQSGTLGAVPVNGGMFPIFIARNTESVAYGCSLYTVGPTLCSGLPLPLYVNGNGKYGSVNLYVEGEAQPYNNIVKLYTHGF